MVEPSSDPQRVSLDTILAATLVLSLTHHSSPWYAEHYVRAIAVFGLLFPRLRTQSLFWVTLTTVLATHCWLDWYWVDNHKYLLAYWCLALTLSIGNSTEHPVDHRLIRTAAILIGLVMALAAAWKLVTPEYRDGSFYEFMLISDQRFTPKTAWLLNLSDADLEINRKLLHVLREGPLIGAPILPSVELRSSPLVSFASHVLTWSTVITEAALGILYLVPTQWTPVIRTRDILLLVFLAGTYLVAPVFGFGSILAVMGAVVTDNKICRNLFISAIPILELYNVAHLLSL